MSAIAHWFKKIRNACFPEPPAGGASLPAEVEEINTFRQLLADGDPTAGQVFADLLASRPDNANVLALAGEAHTLTRLGLLLLEKGRPDDGILVLARAAQAAPEDASAHNNLGAALGFAGHHADALVSLDRALRLAPTNGQYLCNAAQAALRLRRPDLMDSYLERLPEEDRELPQALCLLGALAMDRGQPAAAEEHFRRALQREADDKILLSLGHVLQHQGKTAEARAVWEQAIRIAPDQAGAYHNLGVIHAESERLDEALALYEKALAIMPELHGTRLARAMALLARGDYEAGWPAYESRLEVEPIKSDTLLFGAEDRWQGEDLAGKSILIWGEQGLGDQLQFIRYIPQVAARNPGELIVYCHRSLLGLFSGIAGVSSVVALDQPIPACDCYSPLLSLPAIFATRQGTIPAKVPYLWADAARQEAWRRRLAGEKRLRVGLVWGGNPRREDRDAERILRRRSMALKEFQPLWEVAGASFFSLQKGEPVMQLQDWPPHLELFDYSHELEDFSDTAALIMNLDLVISVDTSVVHLAGALGKPVWVLSRLGGCWRWLQDREDSPWYPSARIFRQQESHDWSTVIAEIREALARQVASRELAGPGPKSS